MPKQPNYSDKDWDAINYKKDKQIAYFNAVNAAIQIITNKKEEYVGKSNVTIEEHLVKWRDWLIKEWEEWYQKQQKESVVPASNIGQSINESSIYEQGRFKEDEDIKANSQEKKI